MGCLILKAASATFVPKGLPKEKVQWSVFTITKDGDYLQSLQNIDKQAKVHDLGKRINQLVYKLYDLTPEEIAIVEGSNNRNKTRQGANKQLKAIEALPGAVLREVSDLKEDRED